ncbi:MAG: LysR family transcriptional regulator [Candidatus Nanoarchaeia archaeon]
MDSLHPNFRLWIYSDKRNGVFGDGKARLLEKIKETGSLKKTAELLNISYRKAWGDLKKAESCMSMRLVKRERGGKKGGKTILTENGAMLLQAYNSFRIRIEKYVEKELANMLRRMK